MSGIEFAPLVPLALIGMLAAAAAVLILFGLTKRVPGTIWRTVVMAALTLALLNPTFFNERRTPLSDVAVMVIDESTSQSIGARRQRTQAAATQVAERLGRERELELRTVRVADSGVGDGTRLIEALTNTLSDVPTERFAGAIVITDGQVHDIPDDGKLPLSGPLHVLLTGARDEIDRRLLIEKAPSYGIVGDRVGIAVRVDDPANHGQPVEITVRADNGTTSSTRVAVGETAELSYVIEHAGTTALEFSVEGGSDELTLDNNRVAAVINGVRDRLRVMLVSGEPSPGLRTWRNLLKADPSVDLIHFTILRPPDKQDLTPVRELSLIPFPTTELFAANLNEFDLIIFDRYHRRGILPMLYLGNVVDYVLNGGAVLDTAGVAFSGELSLATTPLRAILPGQPTGRVLERGFRPALTVEGRRHPVTGDLDGGRSGDGDQPGWGRWFRLIEARVVDGTVLLQDPEERPILALNRVGEGRIAQLLSDQSWLWARGVDGGGPQADLLRRLVHWLMKEPDLEEEALVARVDGETLRIDRRSLAAVSGPVTVTAPDGSSQEVTLSATDDGAATASITVDRPGLYRLDHGDQSETVVVGAANPAEVADVRTTDAHLAPLASANGGAVTWLSEQSTPDIRRVATDRATTGRGWIGLLANKHYLVSGLRQVTLMPAWLLLILLLGGLMLAWRAEGS